MYRLCTIKNDKAGHDFIQTLREQLDDCGKKVRLRGRGHRRGIARYRNELPVSLATSIAIYVGRK